MEVTRGVHSNTAQVPFAVVDTGVVPAVPVAASKPHRARRRTPLGLRILVVVAAVAVLAGIAGLLIHRYKPHWLDTVGITHSPKTTTSTTGASTTTAAPTIFKVSGTSADSATFSVHASTFSVQVTAVGNPSWVQATQAGKTTPTYGAVLAANDSEHFTVDHALTVVVGSVSAHVYISVDGKPVGFYLPPAAPYTMIFKGVS